MNRAPTYHIQSPWFHPQGPISKAQWCMDVILAVERGTQRNVLGSLGPAWATRVLLRKKQTDKWSSLLVLKVRRLTKYSGLGPEDLLIGTFCSSKGRKTEGTGSAKALVPCTLAAFRCANDCGLPGLLQSSADCSPASFWIPG